MTEPRPTIPQVMARFKAYHEKNPTWGSLHIVLDDGNVSDTDVRHCIGFARKSEDVEGEALAQILLSMTKTQRISIGRLL